ncbi:M23 family metallopeptidase [Alteromonas flava]|uniref:M23 family metallopeptidase n=1 Tax=Alteromonas flava TaxID=2048003 RepID=UPI000C28D89D|nr:M23 family metallopeptidase [Alteromonas flava]
MLKLCSVLLSWFIAAFTYATPFTLIDQPQPGALVRGQLTQAEVVYYQGDALKISPEGWFVFGIDREASGEITLAWEIQGERFEKRYALPVREYDIQRIDGLPENMVSPPKDVLERIKKDNQQVAQARSGNSDFEFFVQPFIWPAEGPISGVYGSQRVLNGQPKRPHFGVDVAGPVGTPVVAPADGVVTLFVPDMYYSGGTLIIDHGHQVTSTFIHLHKAHVSAGDRVKQGQLIAEIGDTGRVTGAHLDWRINWGRVRVDPQLLVPARE